MRRHYDLFDEVLIPLGIILGALLLGYLLERLLLRRLIQKRHNAGLSTGAQIVASFTGLVTLWAGLFAASIVVEDFPLRPSAEMLIEKVLRVLLIVTVTMLLLRIAVVIVRKFSSVRERALPSISIVENIARGFVIVLGGITIFHSLGVSVTPMLTALGVGGLAVALALQDTLSNFFAGIYIIVSKQLDPGDLIRLSTGEEGYIQDIAWRVTTLRTANNTLIIVPNSKFSTSIITNFDKPERMTGVSVPFIVDAELDLDGYSAMLIEAAKSQNVSEPAVRFTSFSQSEATLTLAFRLPELSSKLSVMDGLLREVYRRSKEQGFTRPRVVNLPIVQVQRSEGDDGGEGLLKIG